MSTITAGMVKELREKTGAGLLDCKNALTKCGGDMEKAIENLRKKGMASAAKKSGRLASEGLLHLQVEGNVASLVEVNSETDFVAKNEAFQKFVAQIGNLILQKRPANLEEMLKLDFEGSGKDVGLVTKEMVVKIGENISIRRFTVMEAGPGENLGAYTHMGSKIAAIVKVKGDSEKLSEEVLKELAMHVAAASPSFLSGDRIPKEVMQKEEEIYLAQMKDSGKPAEILEKIVQGKLKKFAAEVCFVDQSFIRDPDGKNSVAKYLKGIDPSASVVDFVRFQVGEGMAKKEEDFAAEVAKQIKS